MEHQSRHFWVHDIWSSREICGGFVTLFYNLLENEAKSQPFFRMNREKFRDSLKIMELKPERKYKFQETNLGY
jgi:hypothetical protein